MSIESFITTEQLASLRKTNNQTAAIHLTIRVLVHVSLLAGFIASLDVSIWLGLCLWYAYALQLQFWGYAGLGHELFHNKVFSSKKINSALYTIASVITWNNAELFARSHSYHHRHTFDEKDGEALSERNWSNSNLLLYALIDVNLMRRRIYYVVCNSLGYFPGFKKIDDPRIVTSARLVLIGNASIMALVYWLSANPLAVALFILAPFTATLPNKLLAKAQHVGLGGFAAEGPLFHSRTLKLPSWVSFFYANMNYHAEHHLAPFIPYYHLPAVHRLLAEQEQIKAVSFGAFIRMFWQRRDQPAFS